MSAATTGERRDEPNEDFTEIPDRFPVLDFLRVGELEIHVAVGGDEVALVLRRQQRQYVAARCGGASDAALTSIPHFNRTSTDFPVKSWRNGFGFTG